MKALPHDVIIVGAGLAGLSLALGLAAQRRRVLVLDARPAAPLPQAGSGYDQRIYAISPASVEWLKAIRVWPQVDAARITPVYDMRIHGDAPDMASWLPAGEGLHLSAYRAGVAELCHIIEERELLRIVAGGVGFVPDIEIVRPVQLASLQSGDDAITLTLADGRALEAQLVVGADGAGSWVRAAAGIGVDETPYGQTAVVANFHIEKPHFNCATQWFRAETGAASGADMSVMAWLPLPDHQVSMVWSAPDALAAELAALPPDDLAARVGAAGSSLFGALRPAGPCAMFALRNLKAHRQIASRVALVGDAAHVVHPLMGQGLNLGFGDGAALLEVLDGARDAGEALALRRYERARKAAILEMHALTHGLQRLFSAQHPALRALRNIGLNLTGQLPVIPELLVQRATRLFQ